jgi:glycosyltransferase involved in cell wall biosynthesis
MKILLVHNFYQQPGGEDVVFGQERDVLRRAGHTVISYERSNWEADRYTGLRRLQLAARTIWSENTRQQFAQLLHREQPDVVHAHNTFTMISPSIFSACHEAGVAVVKTLHNYRLCCPAATFFRDGHPCEDCLDKNLWCSVSHGCYRHSRAATATVALEMSVHRMRDTWTRDVDCYIALTDFARRKFLRAGLPADRLFVKPNFVDPDPGMRGDGEGDYALFVGRLSEERVRTMLAAWSLLRIRRIPLVIIGGGPDLEGLREYTRRSGLDHITLLGHMPRDKVLAAMREARFLVFSSEWYENFPVTIAESFACGVPVVCSRIGAMQEIVQDGQTGLNFTSGDAADLAAKVEWAWDHPQQLRTLGAQGRREYEAKYTAEKSYPLLMDIYRTAMQRRVRKLPELVPKNESKLMHAAGPHS